MISLAILTYLVLGFAVLYLGSYFGEDVSLTKGSEELMWFCLLIVAFWPFLLVFWGFVCVGTAATKVWELGKSHQQRTET